MKLNIEDFKSVIVEQHDGSTYLINVKDDVLSFKQIDIVNHSELKECEKIKKYFETILNNKNDASKDEEKAYKKWIEDTFKCSNNKISKNLLKHYKNIPDEIEINNSEVPYKSDENEYLNCSPKEKEKFEKFIKEKENSILKKAKYIEKEILKNEQE